MHSQEWDNLGTHDQDLIVSGRYSSAKALENFETLGNAIQDLSGSSNLQHDVNIISMVINNIDSKTSMTGALKGFDMKMLHNGQISSIFRQYDQFGMTKDFASANDGVEDDGVAYTDKNIVTYNLRNWRGDGYTKNSVSPTVANLQSTFVHEAGGHFFNKLEGDAITSQHIEVYKLEMQHSSWEYTTPNYKKYMRNNLQDLQMEVHGR